MGGCQNHGPFLGTLNSRCRIVIGILKGTIILTIAHLGTVGPQTLNPLYLELQGFGVQSFFRRRERFPILGMRTRSWGSSLSLGFRV